MSYEDRVYQEYCYGRAYYNHPELKEGTRSRLIERDNNPKWMHKSINTVDLKDVAYF
jgi:hypothetical protein